MYRKDINYLVEWRKRKSRRPLIIRGARQIGKTWLVREFAQQFDFLVEINFDKHPEKVQLFKSRKIDKIIDLLQIDSDIDITPGKTLLFFDEIQAAPEIVPLLRYFYEERPDIHIICAGSLLEFLLAEHVFSMPVGRIEYLHFGPMDFEEFLWAQEQDRLVKFLSTFSLADSIPESIHQNLLYYVKLFWAIGGMPAAVKRFCDSGELAEALREHEIILQTYEDDFGKYRKRIYPQRLRKVFHRLPALVGGKLKYVNIDPGERSRELADSLHLLELARIFYRVRHSAGNGIPLAAEAKEKDFKPLFLDAGLVSTSLGLNLVKLEIADDLLMINNGAMAEQFIGQHLLYDRPAYEKPQLFYWNREKRGSSAEVDYLIAYESQVVPVEVKAGATGSLKSLQVFIAEKKVPVALRFNTMQPSCLRQKTAELITLPLYLVGQTKRLLAEIFLSSNIPN
ncbi:MAG: AAA family ATPase [Deltaproteobacteria bacterium]|nr:MAG: AAA family ATPase [Deltaproteobacteria bacterium]